MASSRKSPSASARAFLEAHGKKSLALGLSGGVDSVVLLHLLKDHPGIRALHVHHGLSPNADAWTAFCRTLCREWQVPLTVRKVRVAKSGKGLEAAAREARYAAFGEAEAKCIVLAHHLDDQAETVLMNLLRGAGVRGASGMRALSRFEGKLLARPLLDVPREEILAYAERHGLQWVEDESNTDESLTRNFVRHRLGPLIATRFPGWKRALGRAAQHFARRDATAEALLRKFLADKGLSAPSEAALVEMLRQLTGPRSGARIVHAGVAYRVYRDTLHPDPGAKPDLEPVPWRGERRLALPALGGELRFTPGDGIDARRIKESCFVVRLRSGGERLQLDARRPRRTLKNLFQEAGVPTWERERLPLIFCGEDLVWAPGLGVDVRYRGRGLVPRWRRL